MFLFRDGFVTDRGIASRPVLAPFWTLKGAFPLSTLANHQRPSGGQRRALRCGPALAIERKAASISPKWTPSNSSHIRAGVSHSSGGRHSSRQQCCHSRLLTVSLVLTFLSERFQLLPSGLRRFCSRGGPAIGFGAHSAFGRSSSAPVWSVSTVPRFHSARHPVDLCCCYSRWRSAVFLPRPFIAVRTSPGRLA